MIDKKATAKKQSRNVIDSKTSRYGKSGKPINGVLSGKTGKAAGQAQRKKAAKLHAKQAAAYQKKISKRLDRFGTAFLIAIFVTSGLIEVKEELDRRKKNGEG